MDHPVLQVTQFQSLQDYTVIFNQMQQFTNERQDEDDALWLLSHPPVYTQGLAGKDEHILSPLPHPLQAVDRGGQITFHDPGQIMGYLLCDLKRLNFNIIDLIEAIEHSILDTLHHYQIAAKTDTQYGRGIYVNDRKIASIGLKVKRYRSYHGFSLNYQSNLADFDYINPCGIQHMQMANITDYTTHISRSNIESTLIKYVRKHFNYVTVSNVIL